MTWRTVIGSCVIIAVATLCGILLMFANQGDTETVQNILGGLGFAALMGAFFFGIPWAVDRWG